jgi:hypothetical protein
MHVHLVELLVSLIVVFQTLEAPAARLASDIHLQRPREDPRRALALFAMLCNLGRLCSSISQTASPQTTHQTSTIHRLRSLPAVPPNDGPSDIGRLQVLLRRSNALRSHAQAQ